MFKAELKELGFTDNQTKIYLALLKNGVLNPTELAKITGLHRPYVYDAVEKLMENGTINSVSINNKKYYQAVGLNVLRENIELKLKNLDDIIPKLVALSKTSKEETHVELHKGKRVYRTLIKDLTANFQKNEVVYLINLDESVLEKVEPIYLKQYFTIIKEKKVKEKIIIAKGGKRFKESRLEYRELAKDYIGETATAIYKDNVYLFILGEPNYLIIIKNKKVAETYMKNFNLLWDTAKD